MTGEKDAPAEMPGDAVRRLICDSGLASAERLEHQGPYLADAMAAIRVVLERQYPGRIETQKGAGDPTNGAAG